MGRVAVIIDQEYDVFGDRWDVREYRDTRYGFPVALGWPHGQPRGAGGIGAPRVILTRPLARFLEEHRQKPGKLRDLPFSRTTLKRLRKLLGHHWYRDRAQWWEERIEDLSTLTLEEFARKHGVSPGAAEDARLKLCGRKLRPAYWWREPDVSQIILTAPTAVAAERLDISPGSVRRLRWLLKSGDVGSGG